MIETDFSGIAHCQAFPYFSPEPFSPDGQWMEVQVREGGEWNYRFGLMSTGCLQDPAQDCDLRFIEDAPVDWGGDVRPNVVWFPDGSKLLYLIAGCTGASDATFWTYDVTLDTVDVLTTRPKCYEFVYNINGQPIWSPDGSGVVLYGGLDGFFLFMPETGQIRRLLSGAPQAWILGSFTLPP